MIVRKIQLRGFRTFSETATFEFGKNPGLYFLEGESNEVDTSLGSNGVGKSTIWSALCWVLYGKTADGLKAGDLKSWHSSEKGYAVKLWLGRHVIERTWRPNKLTFDGEVVEQKRLDELVGLSFDTFVSTIVLAQDQDMFFDLSPAKKLSLLTSVLGLDKWTDFSLKARASANEIQEDIHSAEKITSNLDGRIASLDIDGLEHKQKNWSKERTQAIRDFDAKIETGSEDRGIIRKSLKKAKAKLARLRALVEELSEEKFILRDNFDEAKRRRLEVESKAASLEDRIVEAEHHISEVRQGKGSCDLCGQKIDVRKKKRYLAELKASLKTKQTKKQRLSARLEELDAEERQCEEAFLECSTELKEAKESLSKLERGVSSLEKDFALVDTSLKSLKLRKKEHVEQESPYAELLQKAEDEYRQLSARLRSKNSKLKRLKARYEHVSYWVQGFKEVRLYLIEEALSHLELETNRALQDLGFSSDWRVSYAVARRTKSGTTATGFSVDVKGPMTKGKTVPFAAWSGGERQRLKIAGSMGFMSLVSAHTGMDLGIEVYDEPTRSLSAEGIYSLLEALRKRALSTGKRVWLVDHHTFDYGDFSGRTLVSKYENGSKLQQE